MSAEAFLLVDDDAVFRSRLARAFRERGYDVREAATVEQAEAAACEDSPEFAVLDLRLAEGSGLDVARRLLEIDPATRIVMLTGYGSIANTVQAMRLGVVGYLTKPASVDDILRALELLAPGAAAEETVPSLSRVEWEHINRVLEDCGGNVSAAARILGLHRRSLQRKLQRYPSAR
ncbi:MAG: response regulator [Deltaproteobacteria bacterium]|nr:response regulator [Deltaproteobacteria bacterium]